MKRNAFLMLLLMLCLLLCVFFSSCGCNATEPENNSNSSENGKKPNLDYCEHTFETIEGQDATCVESGVTDSVVCTRCGAVTMPQLTIEPKGHDFTPTFTIDSACNGGEGYTAKICRRCGFTENDFGGEIIHPHEFERYTKEANCTDDGYEDAFKCKKCERLIYTKHVESLGHSYGDYIESGENHYRICSRCQYKQYSEHECDYTVIKTPNCYEEGRKVGVCEDCGKEIEKTLEVKHQWNDGRVINKPTCVEMGKALYNCLVCDATKETGIGAKGHDYDDGIVTKEPSCEDGGEKIQICKVCGQRNVEGIDALDHLWDAGTVTKAPTCDTEGSEHFVCSRCGKEKDVVLPKQHDFKIVVLRDPTCTQTGEYKLNCAECKAQIKIEGSIKHNAIRTEEKKASCTEDGNNEYWHCINCDKYFSNVTEEQLTVDYEGHKYSFEYMVYEYVEVAFEKLILKATGHDFSDTALRYDDKEHYVLCANKCGAKNSMEEHTIEIAYGLEKKKDGEQYIIYYIESYGCTKCGYEKEEISRREFLHEHDAYEILREVKPTCTQNGLTSGLACTLCDRIEIEQEITPALGHNFVNSICTRCGLLLSTGTPGLEYELNSEGTAYILSGIGTATTPFVVIGSEHKGLPVTEIKADAFKGNYSIISLVIPSTITKIGENAFYECHKLVEVYNLSDHISVLNNSSNGYVGNYVLTIHNSISSVSKLITTDKGYVFYTGGPFYLIGYVGNEAKLALPNMFMGREYSIYKYAFYKDQSLTSVTIGTKTKGIGKYAFKDCFYITEINFRALSMDNLDFDNDTFDAAGKGAAETKVIIGRNVTRLPSYLFYDANFITSVELENGNVLREVGGHAFGYCRSLGGVYIGDVASWCKIDFEDALSNPLNYAHNLYLNNELVTELVIPDGVKSIGYVVFINCTSIRKLIISESVEGIALKAFYNCTSLESIEVASGNEILKSIDGNLYDVTEKILYMYAMGKKDESFVIPSTVEGLAADAFCNSIWLKNLTIPNSVKRIENKVFYGCSSLEYNELDGALYLGNEQNPYLVLVKAKDQSITSCVIHDATRIICEGAFENHTELTSLTIGKGVTQIGKDAFDFCVDLVEINFYATAMNDLSGYNGVFRCAGGSKGIRVVVGANVTRIPANLFNPREDPSDAPEIVSVEIEQGSTLKEIGWGAFSNCQRLTSIVMPNTVESIGSDAFSGCSSLKFNEYDNAYYLGSEENPYLILIRAKDDSITSCIIHDETKTVAKGAFAYLDSLTSITIGAGIKSLVDNTFVRCDNLSELRFNATAMNDVVVFNNVFWLTGNKMKVIFGANVTRIPANLLSNVDVISIEFENGSVCKSIGEGAFVGCNSLVSIELPSSITSIEENVFYYCSSLRKVHIEDIGAWCNIVFGNEHSNPLTYGAKLYMNDEVIRGDIEIPYGVTKIPSHSFSRTDITGITMPGSVTLIEYGAFFECTALTKANYLGTVGQWCGIEFASPDTNPLYYSKKLYINGNLVTELVIPDTVTKINSYAFYNCTSIIGVSIPDSVTSIGEFAFLGCDFERYTIYDNACYVGNEQNPYLLLVRAKNDDITSCTIHQNTRFINDQAFSNCMMLTEATIGNGVVSIGAYAFEKCSSLKNITIPGSVKSVGDYAFMGCLDITSVTMLEGVTKIGYMAFSDCTSLTSTVIPDSVTSIGYMAFYDCTSLTIYCEAIKMPSDWDSNWNYSNCPVVWGYEQ